MLQKILRYQNECTLEYVQYSLLIFLIQTITKTTSVSFVYERRLLHRQLKFLILLSVIDLSRNVVTELFSLSIFWINLEQ